MLKRLRRQLVLLSSLLTGAVLLAMAAYSLHISQAALTNQYEQDLAQTSSTMFSYISSVPSAVRAQVVTDYAAVYKYGGEVQYVASTNTTTETLEAIAQKAKQQVSGYEFMASINLAEATTSVYGVQSYFDFASDTTATPMSILVTQSTMAQGNALVTEGGKFYRVAATLMESDAYDTELYVIQDRQEELKAIGSLQWTYFGAALLGLLMMVGAGLFLSERAIKPVEKSIQQQHDFVAAASHELRTPVAAIRANAEVLGDAPLNGFEPYLNAINLESQRMSRLVNDLMDLARADAGQWQLKEEIVDAQACVERVCGLLMPLAKNSGVSIHKQLQRAFAKADEERLVQVLTVLIDNAIRHGKAGGQVRVGVGKEDKAVLIFVEDDGAGIPLEYQERVFERFFRLDDARSGQGSGLGLSIAKRLTEQMQGQLSLTQSGLGGCRFTVHLKEGTLS